MTGNRTVLSAWVLMIISFIACTYNKNEIFIPPVEEEKPTLEAGFVDEELTINSGYWATADYLSVSATNKVTGEVAAEDGWLNVNGMLNGTADFNGGSPAELRLKAAYSSDHLYILAQWKDVSFNASNISWLYNGPADPNKLDDPTGWTGQRNDDNLILAFSSGSANKDIWKWSLALSEPLGYGIDMYDGGSGWQNDSGSPMFVKNATDGNRSGPKYEWNGTDQDLERALAGQTRLDPGFFILNKMDFEGDIVSGESLYQSKCAFCHGTEGEGGGAFYPSSPAINIPGKLNRNTREGLDAFLSNPDTHPDRGSINWNAFTDEQKLDVGAKIRALAGVPGYYLQAPSGSVC